MIKSYPNIKQAFGLFGLFILITLLVGLAVSGISSFAPNSLFTLVGTTVTMLIVIAIALNFRGSKANYLFARRRAAAPMAYGVSALFTLFLIFVIDPITSLIPMPEIVKRLFEEALSKDIYTYLAVGIAAPILEELLFRKIILEGFEMNYGARKAIIWSALLFALFHLNPWQGIGAFCAGLFLGWLYIKTRDIWLCIFIHFFNNTLSFVAFISFDDPFFSMLDLTEGNYYSLAAIIAISLIAMYFCYRILIRHFQLRSPDVAAAVENERLD